MKTALGLLIPELRESEDEKIDEKIREDIIGGLMWQRDNLKSEGPHNNNLILPGFCLTVGKHLTYLEKQKDQKPTWSEEDEKMRDSILAELANHICYNKPLDGMPSGTGWTSYKYQQEMDWLTNRLKRIRPSLKPREEQMEALRKAVNKLAKTDVADSVRLSIMYDNLKKL